MNEAGSSIALSCTVGGHNGYHQTIMVFESMYLVGIFITLVFVIAFTDQYFLKRIGMRFSNDLTFAPTVLLFVFYLRAESCSHPVFCFYPLEKYTIVVLNAWPSNDPIKPLLEWQVKSGSALSRQSMPISKRWSCE